MEIQYQSKDGGRLSAVRKDIDDINDQIRLVGDKVYLLDERLSPIPGRMGEVEHGMTSYRGQLDTLAERNNLHSARLKYLREELDNMKLENGMLLDRMRNQPTSRVEQVRFDPVPQTSRGRFEPPPQDGPCYDYDAGLLADPYTKGGYVQDPRPASNDRKYEPSPLLVPEVAKPDDNMPDYAPLRGESRSSRASSMDENYKREELDRRRRREIYGPHDYTAINPQLWEPLPNKRTRPFHHKADPSTSGLFLLRFHEACLSDMNLALHRLQRQLGASGAYVSIASSDNVMLILGSSNDWRLDKNRPRKQMRMAYDCVQNAMLSIWFPAKVNADEVFRSEYNNRFRDEIFLYPHQYQSAFLPLREVPRDKFDSFLVIEVHGKYDAGDLQNFEDNSRAIIQQLCPRSQPFFISLTYKQPHMSIETIKGGGLFREGSRVFVSAFEQLTDIADVWTKGDLYGMMVKTGINPAHVQVYAFSTKDTKERFSTPYWH